jgi:sulfite reductase alpha subunit-like flavoprotein
MMQIREAKQGSSFGEMFLYFGCREPKVDDLYIDEIRRLKDERVITDFHIAYSRKTDKKVIELISLNKNLKFLIINFVLSNIKVYVQDLIGMNSEKIYKAIDKDKGHFYICGEITMAAQVIEALESILKTMGVKDPKEFISNLKDEHRFHEDIFGNNDQHNSVSSQNLGA